MNTFLHAHATHPDAHMALALAAAQIEAQRAGRREMGQPDRWTLGWIYFTEPYAPRAETLLDDLRQRWPGVSWVGAVGFGVVVQGVEYIDEPALVLMLGDPAPGTFELFSGEHPLHRPDLLTAQVHADGATPDLDELVGELSQRVRTGYLFGGVASARGRSLQICAPADRPDRGVYEGGISGVALGAEVPVISRVTQGCQPVGRVHTVTRVDRQVVLELDGAPALPVLLEAFGIDLNQPQEALPRLRATLVGLTDAHDAAVVHHGQFGADTRVRHLIGLDPGRQGVAVADSVDTGVQLAFCTRHVDAARRDLVRICAELREELSAEADEVSSSAPLERVVGAVYVSCVGRGGRYFGGESAEMQILQHALGDVPLVGFFAAGEIAHRHLYGYTGVLTLFLRPA